MLQPHCEQEHQEQQLPRRYPHAVNNFLLIGRNRGGLSCRRCCVCVTVPPSVKASLEDPARFSALSVMSYVFEPELLADSMVVAWSTVAADVAVMFPASLSSIRSTSNCLSGITHAVNDFLGKAANGVGLSCRRCVYQSRSYRSPEHHWWNQQGSRRCP